MVPYVSNVRYLSKMSSMTEKAYKKMIYFYNTKKLEIRSSKKKSPQTSSTCIYDFRKKKITFNNNLSSISNELWHVVVPSSQTMLKQIQASTLTSLT